MLRSCARSWARRTHAPPGLDHPQSTAGPPRPGRAASRCSVERVAHAGDAQVASVCPRNGMYSMNRTTVSAARGAKCRTMGRSVFVAPAHDHRVDLDGGEACTPRRIDAFQHARKVTAVSHLAKHAGLDGITRHVTRRSPPQRARQLVARAGARWWSSRGRRHRSRRACDHGAVLDAREASASQADPTHPHGRKHAHDRDLLEGQQRVAAQSSSSGMQYAAVVALVGHMTRRCMSTAKARPTPSVAVSSVSLRQTHASSPLAATRRATRRRHPPRHPHPAQEALVAASSDRRVGGACRGSRSGSGRRRTPPSSSKT